MRRPHRHAKTDGCHFDTHAQRPFVFDIRSGKPHAHHARRSRRGREHDNGPDVRLIAHALLVLVIAAAIGLGLTWATASRGTNFGTLTIGTWTARPKIGTSDINPYARASVARSGELPLAAGDGIAFAAKADDTARPLDGRCDVTVSGVTSSSRRTMTRGPSRST